MSGNHSLPQLANSLHEGLDEEVSDPVVPNDLADDLFIPQCGLMHSGQLPTAPMERLQEGEIVLGKEQSLL